MPVICESAGAVLSRDRWYRYKLWRVLRKVDKQKIVAFIMLNPSTADEQEDDPTIRRCLAFADQWGFDTLVVVNLFAFRTTDPKELRVAEDPVGQNNDEFIEEVAKNAKLVVAAWGNNAVWKGRHAMRSKDVASIVAKHQDLYCFGKTKKNQPKHPLYVKADTELVGFRRRRR